MGETHGADRNSPTESPKPAEFIRSRTRIATADHGSKTSDFIDDPVRICKCVLMRTLDHYPFSRARYHLVALAAEDIFFVV